MTQTYQEMADTIIKKRNTIRKKVNQIQKYQFRTEFTDYIIANNKFKNIIDLIIEFYDLSIDTDDNQLILEEVLKQEGVTITTVSSTTSTVGRTIVTFNNVFGLKINIIFYSDTNKSVRCDILKNGIVLKSTREDVDRDTLATYVADYREEQG